MDKLPRIGQPDFALILEDAIFNNLKSGGNLVLGTNDLRPETRQALLQAVYNSQQRQALAKGTGHEWEKAGVQGAWDYYQTGGQMGSDDYYYGDQLAHPKLIGSPMYNARNTIGSFYPDIRPNGDVYMSDKYDFTEGSKSAGGLMWNLGRANTSGNNTVEFKDVYLGNINSLNGGK